jgi:hypothetical protein
MASLLKSSDVAEDGNLPVANWDAVLKGARQIFSERKNRTSRYV